VGTALRHFLEPDQLRTNPLLWSRLVDAEIGGDPEPARRIQALRHIFERQAAQFRAAPKTEILYQTLRVTCFKPALSQATAAAELGISARTLRRHRLRAAVFLGAWLWEAELEYLSSRRQP